MPKWHMIYNESDIKLGKRFVGKQRTLSLDGAEGIEFSVFFLTGEEAYYYRINDTYVTSGDMEDAGHVWISLDEPHQIDERNLIPPQKIDWQ